MGSPDLKVLVKQVVYDPIGLDLPARPDTAIVVGKAIGDKANRTGVYGYSERSVAIFGESPVFAGFFQGDVHINGQLDLEDGDVHIAGNLTVVGNLNVTGNLQVKGHSFEELLTRIAELESQVNVLMQQVFPPPPPPKKPVDHHPGKFPNP
jgi:hypothetical protein